MVFKDRVYTLKEPSILLDVFDERVPSDAIATVHVCKAMADGEHVDRITLVKHPVARVYSILKQLDHPLVADPRGPEGVAHDSLPGIVEVDGREGREGTSEAVPGADDGVHGWSDVGPNLIGDRGVLGTEAVVDMCTVEPGSPNVKIGDDIAET